jgi:hypothetical protein
MIVVPQFQARRYLLVFVALQLADVVTTSWNLSHYGFREFNPIVGYIWMQGLGTYVVFKLLQIAIATWMLAHNAYRFFLLTAIGLSAIPVAMNIIAFGRWLAL